MKVLAWLLFLANLGLLVYFNLDHIMPSPPQIKWAELEPEKMRLLSDAEIQTLPKLASASETHDLETNNAETNIQLAPVENSPAKIATSCFDWGTFTSVNIENAKNAVAQLSLDAEVKEHSPQTNKRFWVFIPPLKNAQAAQNYANALRNLGVEDLFVVQEPAWKNAISFGLFEDETLAQNLLRELKAKGVKKVEKSLWNPKGQISLIFNQLNDDEAAALEGLKADFPQTKLKKIGCE
ncbi:MAG TPA: sporulation protein [Methylotenera sp.]|nr:sporulation protein [Methylotenera sp.]HPH06469.1 sporulation protein [Methylotenera sp.]HPN01230.1 sporulation protein [Methylotenera sp.]